MYAMRLPGARAVAISARNTANYIRNVPTKREYRHSKIVMAIGIMRHRLYFTT